MKNHLVLFARAPRIGKVKTRLASDIGKTAALHFYRRNLLRMQYQLSRGPWTCTVAVASAGDCHHNAFKGQQVIVQPPGDIGKRMRDTLTTFRSDRCVIVGSDIPYITHEHIRRAFHALNNKDFVFGPATDGGFWLVGRRPLAQPGHRFMRNVRWSSRFALEDTLNSLPPQQQTALIDTLSDVDDGDEYRIYCEWLEAKKPSIKPAFQSAG